MPEAVIHSERFPQGYRITTTANELRIEGKAHPAGQLRLNRAKLARFGLRFIDDHYLEVKPSREAEGIVDAMLGSIGRAMEVLRTQKDPTAYRWDVENLKRAFVVLGGLDEGGVQKILN